jgi:vacuolar-type H+-ATPase subunit E/Vma4
VIEDVPWVVGETARAGGGDLLTNEEGRWRLDNSVEDRG